MKKCHLFLLLFINFTMTTQGATGFTFETIDRSDVVKKLNESQKAQFQTLKEQIGEESLKKQKMQQAFVLLYSDKSILDFFSGCDLVRSMLIETWPLFDTEIIKKARDLFKKTEIPKTFSCRLRALEVSALSDERRDVLKKFFALFSLNLFDPTLDGWDMIVVTLMLEKKSFEKFRQAKEAFDRKTPSPPSNILTYIGAIGRQSPPKSLKPKELNPSRDPIRPKMLTRPLSLLPPNAISTKAEDFEGLMLLFERAGNDSGISFPSRGVKRNRGF